MHERTTQGCIVHVNRRKTDFRWRGVNLLPIWKRRRHTHMRLGANPERVQSNPNWPGIARTKERKHKCGNGGGAIEPVTLQRTPSCVQSRQLICPACLINNVANMYQVAARYLSSICARYLSRRGQLWHWRSYHDMIWLRLSPLNCYYCWITLNFGYLNQIFPCIGLDCPSLELTLRETTKPTRNKGWGKNLSFMSTDTWWWTELSRILLMHLNQTNNYL